MSRSHHFKGPMALVLLFLFFGGFSQNVKISVGPSFGTFSFATLKEENRAFAKSVSGSINVPMQTVTDYPSNVGLYLDITSNSNRKSWQSGGFLAINSSVSRLGYADYSGSLTYDNRVSQITLGGVFQTAISQTDYSQFQFRALVGLSFVNNTYVTSLQFVDGPKQEETESYQPINFAIMPSFRYSKVSQKNMRLFLETGYFIDLPGNLFSKDPNNQALISAQGDGPAVEMSGIRVIAGLEFLIK